MADIFNTPELLSLQDLNGEVWKSVIVPGGEIFVSNYGRVKAPERTLTFEWAGKVSHHHHDEEILRPHDNGHGYLNITFRAKKHYIHRLVASAFLDNPKNLPQVDHINGCRNDNRVENLRWVTKKENVRNPITMERHDKASWEHQSPIVQLTSTGDFVKEWSGLTATAKHFGCSISSIHDALSNSKKEVKTFRGFVFVYKKDYDPNKDYSVTFTRNTSSLANVISESGFVDIQNGEILHYFGTAQIAADYYGVSVYNFKATISRLENGLPVGVRKKLPTPTHLKRYRDLTEEQREYVRKNFDRLKR